MISKLKRSYYSTTGEVATKLNKVIDELNRQGKAIKNIPFAKVGDEVVIATDDGSKFFRVVLPEESAKSKEPLQYDGSTIQKGGKSIQYPFETRVGMLRQWLNEDRITEPDRMVTNEQIMVWLKKEDVTPEPSQQVQNVTQGKSGCNPREREYTQSDQEHANRYRPKKEETPFMINGVPTDEYRKIQQGAVEAYKKRIIEDIQEKFKVDNMYDLADPVTGIRLKAVEAVIKVIEDSDG